MAHFEMLKERSGHLPQRAVTDASYGSEENYVYLEQSGVEGYMKYSMFHQEQKRSWRKQRFRVENWEYDSERDEYVCPDQRRLIYLRNQSSTTKNGYRSHRRIYQCSSCADCPFKPQCTRGGGNRYIAINPTWNYYHDQARQRLLSEQGLSLRAQRNIEVETVFGRIKQDWGFRRFTLRGMEKVKTEWGLLCIAHNMAKLAVQ